MINWDAVGALGEILGALAVLGTLGYLAHQIRQSTRQHRLESARSVTEEFNRLNGFFYDLENSEMFARAIDDWDAATLQEQTVTFTFLMQYCQQMQSLFEMWRENMISRDIYEAEETTLLATLGTSGGAQWWLRSQELYGTNFVARINEMLIRKEYPRFIDLLPHLDGQKWTKT